MAVVDVGSVALSDSEGSVGADVGWDPYSDGSAAGCVVSFVVGSVGTADGTLCVAVDGVSGSCSYSF